MQAKFLIFVTYRRFVFQRKVSASYHQFMRYSSVHAYHLLKSPDSSHLGSDTQKKTQLQPRNMSTLDYAKKLWYQSEQGHDHWKKFNWSIEFDWSSCFGSDSLGHLGINPLDREANGLTRLGSKRGWRSFILSPAVSLIEFALLYWRTLLLILSCPPYLFSLVSVLYFLVKFYSLSFVLQVVTFGIKCYIPHYAPIRGPMIITLESQLVPQS